jgi:hypothetical protein
MGDVSAGASVWYHPFLQALHDEIYRARSQTTVSGKHHIPERKGDLELASAPVMLAVPDARGIPEQVLDRNAQEKKIISSREQYPYYEQQEHRPQNRLECDAFNRFHFERLSESRGKCGLPPKVGEEPLTIREVEFVRQVHHNRSRSPHQACSALH